MSNKALSAFCVTDVATAIFDYGSTAEMVKASRVSSIIHAGLHDRTRQRLSRYLAKWVPFGKLMHEMRDTTLSIFDQSSYAFLHCQPDRIRKLTTLYLVCTHSDKERTAAFFIANGYLTVTALSAKQETYHLSLNKYITDLEIFNKGELLIALVSTVNDAIIQAALGTVTTAFMNIIGPNSFWSAYNTGTNGIQSYQNPSYTTGPCPPSFAQKIDCAHRICRNCSVPNHLVIWRTMVERPHKSLCYSHPDCPQTLRTSNDMHCTFMYFGADHRSASSKQIRLEATRNTHAVLWRLGGSCYKGTTAMTPICVVAEDFDKPLFEDSLSNQT